MNQAIPDFVVPQAPVKAHRRTLQFSIRSLLIATSVIALFICVIAVPEAFALVACAALTAILTTAVFYGRGWVRAFAIGSLVPNVLTYLMMFQPIRHPGEALVVVVVSILLSTIVGVVAAAVHGFLKRRGGKVAIPNLPFIRNWFSID